MNFKTIILLTVFTAFTSGNLWARGKISIEDQKYLPATKLKIKPAVQAYLIKLGKKQKKKDPNFTTFSVAEGEKLYFKEQMHSKKKKNRSCATCHSSDPREKTKHVKTGKIKKPLAPYVSRNRFTKVKKIEKWFKRNCKWTLERECTVKEKGDFIFWIYSVDMKSEF